MFQTMQMEEAKLVCTSNFLTTICACFQISRDGYRGAKKILATLLQPHPLYVPVASVQGLLVSRHWRVVPRGRLRLSSCDWGSQREEWWEERRSEMLCFGRRGAWRRGGRAQTSPSPAGLARATAAKRATQRDSEASKRKTCHSSKRASKSYMQFIHSTV